MAVEVAVVAQREHPIGGGALGLVVGARVGVVETPGFEAVGRHGPFLADPFAVEGDGAAGRVDVGDGAEVAVEDVEVVVVAAGGHDLIADSELPVCDGEPEVDVKTAVPEVAGLVEEGAGSVV